MKRPTFAFLACAVFAATLSTLPAQDTDWRREADERIEALRTSEVWLQVLDDRGNLLPQGTQVDVRMTRSAFNFGSAIASWKFEQFGEDHPYFQKVPELFNTIVLENNHKWANFTDPEKRAHADRLVGWAREKGLAIRGHGFFWGMTKHPVIPEPFFTAIKENEPGMEADLIEAAHAHIRQAGSELPFVYEWDVINEPVMQQVAMKYLGAETVEAQAAYLAEMFRVADEAAPQANLVMNEYHILAGPRAHERYLELAKTLLEMGAPIHGVGFQNHWFNGNMRRDPNEIFAQMNEYADLGLSISITEFDTLWGGWGDDKLEAQGDWLETMLVIAYSHPAVENFLIWGFWDGQHWTNNAPLFLEDWTPKPGHEVWQRLVLDEWRTDESLTIGEQSTVNLRAHHGDYEVVTELKGRTYRGQVSIGPDTEAERVMLAPES
ncbi:MAG: endo-1,4-beta-xylanase [Opitutales bacterium]